MEQVIEWFDVAKDECETLRDYAAKLDNVDEKDKLREIMGDEVNHALIALTAACKALGLKVPTDELDDIDEIFEGDGEE
jgi:hypothetical protein